MSQFFVLLSKAASQLLFCVLAKLSTQVQVYGSSRLSGNNHLPSVSIVQQVNVFSMDSKAPVEIVAGIQGKLFKAVATC